MLSASDGVAGVGTNPGSGSRTPGATHSIPPRTCRYVAIRPLGSQDLLIGAPQPTCSAKAPVLPDPVDVSLVAAVALWLDAAFVLMEGVALEAELLAGADVV